MADYKTIARRAGVSIGTVHRVLRNRGRFSESTAARVRAVADELAYTPNIYASNLKRSKVHVFAAIMPRESEDSFYWEAPWRGIRDAVTELDRYRITVRPFAYAERSERSFATQWRRALAEEPDGLVIAATGIAKPGRYVRMLPGGMPRVYIDTDIDDPSRTGYVGQDSRASGMVAGRLLALLSGGQGRIVAVRTLPGTSHITQRVSGLEAYLGRSSKLSLEVVDVDLFGPTPDLLDLAASLSAKPRATGLFVSNSSSAAILDGLQAHSVELPPVVGYDLVPPNVEALRCGRVAFLLNQRPYHQGAQAIRALHRAAVLGSADPHVELLPIDIITPENVDGYL